MLCPVKCRERNTSRFCFVSLLCAVSWGASRKRLESLQPVGQRLGRTQSLHLIRSLRVQTTPSSDQLSTPSGWDFALASQMWLLIWLLLGSFSIR